MTSSLSKDFLFHDTAPGPGMPLFRTSKVDDNCDDGGGVGVAVAEGCCSETGGGVGVAGLDEVGVFNELFTIAPIGDDVLFLSLPALDRSLFN